VPAWIGQQIVDASRHARELVVEPGAFGREPIPERYGKPPVVKLPVHSLEIARKTDEAETMRQEGQRTERTHSRRPGIDQPRPGGGKPMP
jgi:hypothetical protein